MLRMSVASSSRAKGVTPPAWWIEKVRDLVEKMDVSLGDLGRDLADAVGREEAWDHSSVSRFLTEKNMTAPMADAFALLLGIPRPFYEARTLDEAFALQSVAKRYDSAAVNPEQTRRLAVADQVVESEVELVRDRTRPVKSDNEGTGRRGRGGRSHRGRSTTS